MQSLPLRILIAGITSVIAYVVAVAIIFQSPPQHDTALAILLFCFFCTTFVVVLRALEPLQSLPTMLCMYYFSFFYVLPGIVQVSSNTFQMAHLGYSSAVSAESAIVVLVFVLTFCVGQQFVRSNGYEEAVKTIEKSESHRRTLAITLFCGCAIAAGLVCIAFFGFGILLTTRGAFGDSVLDNLGIVSSQFGLLLTLPRALTLVGLLVLIYAIARWRREQPALNAVIGIPMLAMLVPIFAIVNYPPALARNWQFGVLLSMLFMFVKGWRPWLRVGLVVGMLLTMFSLFQWLNVLKDYENKQGMAVDDPITYMKRMDFDGFQTTMNTIAHTNLHGFTGGKQLLTSVLFFVPRSVWQDKSDGTGVITATSLGFDFTNLSTPLPAELYIDFSFVGVVLGGLFFGYFYRRLDYIFGAAVDYGRLSLHLIMVSVLAANTIFIMRGSLYAVVNIFGPIAILCFLVLKAPVLARLFISPSTTQAPTPPLQQR